MELPVVTREHINNMAEEVLKNMEMSVRHMEEMKTQNERAVNQMKYTLSESFDEINNLEREMIEADEKYKQIQILNEYLDDLCDCLKVNLLIY